MQLEFHELAEKYRRMDASEIDIMAADMKANGFDPNYPIMLFHGKILEGCNRYLAACKAGVEAVFRQFQGTLEEAEQFVIRSNENRRHLSQVELSEKRKKRIKAVAAARSQGKSTRAIAEEVGVSQMQVQRDLKVSGETHVSPESKNGKVMGKDGKAYPASKPQEHNPEPSWDDDEEEDEAHSTPKQATNGKPLEIFDDAGKPIPARLVGIFRDAELFENTELAITKAANKLHQVEESKAYQILDQLAKKAKYKRQLFSTYLKSAANLLACIRPSIVCPDCGGAHEPSPENDPCPTCGDRGWLSMEETRK